MGSRSFAVRGLPFVRREKVAIVKDTFILKKRHPEWSPKGGIEGPTGFGRVTPSDKLPPSNAGRPEPVEGPMRPGRHAGGTGR